MGKFIKDSWLVIVSALVFGLLVAGVNGALKGDIEKNKVKKRDNSMVALMGEGCSFELVKVSGQDGKEFEYFIAKKGEEIAGYCFLGTGGGFADRIDLLIAVDSKFDKCKGFAVMYSQETPGFGDKIKPTGPGTFSDEFVNTVCPAQGAKLKVEKTGDKADRSDRTIVAITGATITSDAVTKIVNTEILKMRSLIIK